MILGLSLKKLISKLCMCGGGESGGESDAMGFSSGVGSTGAAPGTPGSAPGTQNRGALDAINAVDKANASAPGTTGSAPGAQNRGALDAINAVDSVNTAAYGNRAQSSDTTEQARNKMAEFEAQNATAKGLLSQNADTIRDNFALAKTSEQQDTDIVGAIGPDYGYQAPVTREDQRDIDSLVHSQQFDNARADMPGRIAAAKEANNTNKYGWDSFLNSLEEGFVLGLPTASPEGVVGSMVAKGIVDVMHNAFEGIMNYANDFGIEDPLGSGFNEDSATNAPSNQEAPSDPFGGGGGGEPSGSGGDQIITPAATPYSAPPAAAPAPANTPGQMPASMTAAMGLLKNKSISNNIRGLLAQKNRRQ